LAVEPVVAAASRKAVVARTADQTVGTRCALELVVARAALGRLKPAKNVALAALAAARLAGQTQPHRRRPARVAEHVVDPSAIEQVAVSGARLVAVGEDVGPPAPG